MMEKQKPESFGLEDVKCPCCGNEINKVWPLGEHVAGNIHLLVECWSGSVEKKAPRHLFTIHLNELPNIMLNPKSFKEKSK